jgi:ketosteroid isomerase-like protein
MTTFHKKIVSQLLGLVIVTCGLGSSGHAALSAADRTAVEKAHDSAAALVESNPAKVDWPAYVDAHYDANAKLLPTNNPLAEGRAAIIEFFSGLPPVSVFKTDDVEIDGDGTVAYVRGTYTVTLRPPDSAEINDKGKYIQIWRKRADGSWRCVLDIFNSDLPASG